MFGGIYSGLTCDKTAVGLCKQRKVSTRVPAVCNAVSCSVQLQADENDQHANNNKTEVLPNVKELQFLFNDSQNEYITYQIKDREELLRRYIQSFADTGSNSASITKLRANSGWGIGLPFRVFVEQNNLTFYPMAGFNARYSGTVKGKASKHEEQCAWSPKSCKHTSSILDIMW